MPDSLLKDICAYITDHADPSANVITANEGNAVGLAAGHYLATAIGADAYASRLAEEARIFRLADSELRNGVNAILRWLTVIIPPVALLKPE